MLLLELISEYFNYIASLQKHSGHRHSQQNLSLCHLSGKRPENGSKKTIINTYGTSIMVYLNYDNFVSRWQWRVTTLWRRRPLATFSVPTRPASLHTQSFVFIRRAANTCCNHWCTQLSKERCPWGRLVSCMPFWGISPTTISSRTISLLLARNILSAQCWRRVYQSDWLDLYPPSLSTFEICKQKHVKLHTWEQKGKSVHTSY